MNVYRTDDPQGEHMAPPARKEGNTIGLIGFILSLTCCLSPVGLLLSFIGLFKAPRGFAVAGTIIGGLVTLLWVWFIIGMMAIGGFGAIPMGIGMDVAITDERIQAYQSETGNLPPDLDAVNMPPQCRTDPWGNAYRYEIAADGVSWTLTTAGADGQFDTADDLVVDGPNVDPNIPGDVLTQWVEAGTYQGGMGDAFSEMFEIFSWFGENAEKPAAVGGSNAPSTPDALPTPEESETPDAPETPEAPESDEELPS